MKCIYCESNETNGVLLCYGCQVDLFPLVSAWAYCGKCGLELPADSNICPNCVAADQATSIVTNEIPVVPATKVAASLTPSQGIEESAEEISVVPSPATSLQKIAAPAPQKPREIAPKDTLASRAEIVRARRFQFLIRSIFALIWLIIVIALLWWARYWANQPIAPIVP